MIPGFGPQMKDFDGRDLEVYALYHKTHADPNLNGHAAGDPFYWNFLQMEFDPRPADPVIGLRLRNVIDAPADAARGGGPLETVASQTGRRPSSQLPPMNTLPNAEVRFYVRGPAAPFEPRVVTAKEQSMWRGLWALNPVQKSS